jgi:hypothetical protein
VRAIKLIITAFADAVAEGQAMRKADDGQDVEEDVAPDYAAYETFDEEEGEDDEQYLGESTLAKLRDARLFADDSEDEE